MQSIVSAKLLALVESQGIKKFIIHRGDGDADVQGILVSIGMVDCCIEHTECKQIWIFTPNMVFSSTLVPKGPKQAMKVYYKTITDTTKILEAQSLRVDDLQLPSAVLKTLHANLKDSTQLLPVLARKFQNWDVGLLER